MNRMLNLYRCLRVLLRQLLGTEPIVHLDKRVNLEFHGGREYGGWAIPRGSVGKNSIVVDIGLGEDISFSKSLIDSFGCCVFGFDPTPRAVAYVGKQQQDNFRLFDVGVAGSTRRAKLYLPNDQEHVSGSITRAGHVGLREVDVQLLGMRDLLNAIGGEKIDLLKIDIEGAEYELLGSDEFAQAVPNVDVICIEFHHRWKEFGRAATREAVSRLKAAGFACVWRAAASNEEFTFARIAK